MINSVEELAREIGQAKQNHDLERLVELESCFVQTKEAGPLPLAPHIELDPKKVKTAGIAEESERVLGLANAVAKAKRKIWFQRQKWTNFRRPVIVSEGDSWFQYPVRLDDVIDVLMDDHLILSLGAAGDLLSNMLSDGEYLRAIGEENADIFLISGGGNDMLHGGRLATFLRPYQDGDDAASLLRPDRWSQFRTELRSNYATIFNSVAIQFPHVKTFCHGYDYPIARDGGKWLGGPLASRGVPKELWNDVIKILIDQLNEILIELAAGSRGKVIHVNCRNVVGPSTNSWYDELHPKDPGYKKVANRFAQSIRSSLQSHPPATELASDTVAQADLKTPTTPKLPPVVAQQFLARQQDLRLPKQFNLRDKASTYVATEAIIDHGRSKVGPLLRPAPSTAVPQDSSEPVGMKPEDVGSPKMDDAALISAKIRMTVDSVLEQGRLPDTGLGAEPSEADQHPTDADLLRQSPCSSLDAWQAHLRADPTAIESYNDYVEVRREFDREESVSRIETRMELLPESDLFFQERIIGASNLEQINFLSRGERAARTVGRLSVITEYGIPAGTGSGFLVGPGLLLTNHHVIATIERAGSGSYVLFDYEYDADNRLKNSERFDLTKELFFTDKDLDFTFVSVAPTGSRGNRIEDYGRMKLIRESGKALKGEEVSIIQHPEGLPKQIAIRESTVVGRKDAFVYYYADTNRGSSGSPVVNDQWFPVALHHRSVPDYYKPCEYVANRGIRISEIYKRLETLADAGSDMCRRIIDRLETDPVNSTTVTTSTNSFDSAVVERFVEPYHELPYDNRGGYDDEFLGRRVRMPMVTDPDGVAAPRIDGATQKYLLTYEHFSLVMHKHRRMAIFTASNVDASPAKKRPEPGKGYSRKALGGLGPNDREKWFEDPRIASNHQLPDRFFEKDDGAFDKGHLTMRADVAWGNDYSEVRRANGDTFHTTNCSPQVAEFNRAIFGFHGLWGELEEIVMKQAADEKLCVFAGPILSSSDQSFRGKDSSGEVLIQVPSAYWKVIVARTDSGLESFAFILEQDLSDTPLEFSLSAEWKRRRVKVKEVEDRAKFFKFPSEVHDADGA
ncbi:DNA/RNA non-specific endonuclease [Stieleria sp. JC731]|uniref:DNA/RNA non-specific endonuclease n=1 Tax=Pirellulaceae TaxID=2691357 RepID=UPI001E4407CB|nr:DNA/RNA non-specific endonuclease [Stieleria sp. JC731]MCC9601050.1 DNA/RNA non-specific endonuclease [Stieleria sp. JC731]